MCAQNVHAATVIFKQAKPQLAIPTVYPFACVCVSDRPFAS